jgi:hypothetical protein
MGLALLVAAAVVAATAVLVLRFLPARTTVAAMPNVSALPVEGAV